ncbi:MAG: alpha/beta hydrolase [Clostridia bacterium]|nr:alpha/beta hydrolase [Clostridia bacterium]
MPVFKIFFVVFMFILFLGMLCFVYQRFAIKRWRKNAYFYGNMVDLGGYKFFHRTLGKGKVTVVFDAGLGIASPVWWDMQEKLAKHAKIVCYDRAGYGWSDQSPLPRNTENMARELKLFLEKAGFKPPYVLVGHSLGGFIAQHFARIYPQETAGVLMIDCALPGTNPQNLKEMPTYAKVTSIEGYTKMMKFGYRLAQLGILRALKYILLSKHPLYTFLGHFPSEARENMFQGYMIPSFSETCIKEYIHLGETEKIHLSGPFPEIPLKFIRCSPEKQKHEMVQMFKLPMNEVNFFMHKTEEVVNAYLKLSPKSELIHAGNSTHTSVLYDAQELLISEITDLIREAQVELYKPSHVS